MSGWNPQQPPYQQQPPVQPFVQPNVQQHVPPQWQGYPYGYTPPLPPRRRWMRRHPVLTALGVLVLLFFGIGAGASLGSSKSQNGTGASSFGSTQTAVAAPATSAAAAVKQTVTFVVTGSPADITYGPAGTSVSGTVPLHVTKPLANPIYYSIEAQLQGGGEVTCKIKVDGKIISQSVASGGYNIAMCEIGQDPLSGKWTDDNAA